MTITRFVHSPLYLHTYNNRDQTKHMNTQSFQSSTPTILQSQKLKMCHVSARRLYIYNSTAQNQSKAPFSWNTLIPFSEKSSLSLKTTFWKKVYPTNSKIVITVFQTQEFLWFWNFLNHEVQVGKPFTE
jgi:hypothetical protein